MEREHSFFPLFFELLVLFSSGVDMIAEPNVMLACGRCHKAEDYVHTQCRWEWLLWLWSVPLKRELFKWKRRWAPVLLQVPVSVKMEEILQNSICGTFWLVWHPTNKTTPSSLVIMFTGHETWQFLQSQSPRTQGDHWGLHSYEQRWEVPVILLL